MRRSMRRLGNQVAIRRALPATLHAPVGARSTTAGTRSLCATRLDCPKASTGSSPIHRASCGRRSVASSAASPPADVPINTTGRVSGLRSTTIAVTNATMAFAFASRTDAARSGAFDRWGVVLGLKWVPTGAASDTALGAVRLGLLGGVF